MLSTKHGIASWLLTAAVAIAWANPTIAQERRGGSAGSAVTGSLKSVDAAAGTITISVVVNQGAGGRDGGERRAPEVADKTFTLAKNAEIVAGAGGAAGRSERGGFGGGGAFKEVKLADLAVGVKISATLSADQKSLDSIAAEGPTVHGVLKTIDATKKTFTIQTAGRGGARGGEAVAGEEHTYTLLPDAELAVDDGRGGRFSVKEAKLADIASGAIVTAKLHVDMKSIQSALAEGPQHQGTIKAIDAAKKTLTLVVGASGRGNEAGEEYQLTVAADAVILVDDGKGRRLSVKLGKLADIPVDAAVAVKLSVDQVNVMSIRAQGATVTGNLKSVDADKGTIVVAQPKGRGDDAMEKTYTVAKDAHITVDGKNAKLSDLKSGDDFHVTLQLSLDQQTVMSISHREAGRR